MIDIKQNLKDLGIRVAKEQNYTYAVVKDDYALVLSNFKNDYYYITLYAGNKHGKTCGHFVKSPKKQKYIKILKQLFQYFQELEKLDEDSYIYLRDRFKELING